MRDHSARQHAADLLEMDSVVVLTGRHDPDAVVAVDPAALRFPADHSRKRLADVVAVVAPDLVAVWLFVARVYLTCLVVAVVFLPVGCWLVADLRSCAPAPVDLAALSLVPAVFLNCLAVVVSKRHLGADPVSP